MDRQISDLRALSDAVLAVAARRSVDQVLQELVERAQQLAGAHYAALGTPDGRGGFSRFLVAGMSDELIASLGPLPRTHGVLGAMLEAPGSVRLADIHDHPDFKGWWPAQHPDMHSFLGVPIVADDGILGAFYLTDKIGEDVFAAADQEVIELLAAHAAIAITNADLRERNREVTVLEERNRLALELHDVVSQKLFGVVMTAQAAGQLAETGDPETASRVDRVAELAREALDELRGLIFELRPADLERDGLAEALTKHVRTQERLHDVSVDLEVGLRRDGEPGDARFDEAVLRIAQEALHNALRHASAQRVAVRLTDDGGQLVLEVSDDGSGFDPSDPATQSRRLGLTSMQERAASIGGRLAIRSSPGAGTTVRLEVGHE